MDNQGLTTAEDASGTWLNATQNPGEPDVYTRAVFFPKVTVDYFVGPCWLYTFVVYVGLTCSICFLGLIGNALTLIVLSREKSRSATFFLLKCLAFGDSFVLVSWTTLQHYGLMLYFVEMRFVLFFKTYNLTLFLQPFCAVAQFMATWLVVIVTWHRYIAVCLPHKVASLGSLRLARIQATVVILGAFICNTPVFTELQIVIGPQGELWVFYRNYVFSDKYQTGYKIITYNVFMYVIPLVCLICMAVKLIKALQKPTFKKEEMTSAMKASHGLNLSLIVVVIIFIVCQIFIPILRVLDLVLPVSGQHCQDVQAYFLPFVVVAKNFNSAINFVIYTLCGRRFRRILFQMLRCGSRSKVRPDTNDSLGGVSTTRANTVTIRVTRSTTKAK